MGNKYDWIARLTILLAVLLFFLVAGGSFLLFGCAEKKPIRAQVVMERACITKVEEGKETRCTGPDMQHLSCTGIVLTYHPGCEVLQIKKQEKK